MLTWFELLGFYAVNVVVWLGIALAYVYFFHETEESLLQTAGGSTEGEKHG